MKIFKTFSGKYPVERNSLGQIDIASVVYRRQNRPDLHFPPRIKAKISEYASNLTFQITLSFMVIRIENTPDFHLALRQQRKKFQIFHQFTTYAEFGD